MERACQPPPALAAEILESLERMIDVMAVEGNMSFMWWWPVVVTLKRGPSKTTEVFQRAVGRGCVPASDGGWLTGRLRKHDGVAQSFVVDRDTLEPCERPSERVASLVADGAVVASITWGDRCSNACLFRDEM